MKRSASILYLLARRLLVPALLATAVIDSIVLALAAWDIGAFAALLDVRLAWEAMWVIAPSVCLGLLLLGIPAGLTVARLGIGPGSAAATLAATGAGGGAVMAVFLGLHAIIELLGLFMLFGAATAGLWTLINRDLFRLHNGA